MAIKQGVCTQNSKGIVLSHYAVFAINTKEHYHGKLFVGQLKSKLTGLLETGYM